MGRMTSPHMDRDGEDHSTKYEKGRMGRMTAPHVDRDGEDESTTNG
jgi:hypothetical protein